MNIESLYKDYIQKSRIFLYPALGIKKGGSVTPIQTFTSWEGHYTKEECKLMTLYYLREDEDFVVFEKQKLIGNARFHDFKLVDEGRGVYVFDYNDLKEDWIKFLTGKYSKLSSPLKKKIQDFFGISNRAYIDGFLYPERYFKLYASVFTTTKEDIPSMQNLLKEVGELCSIPETDKENLIVNIRDLHISKKSV
jgi:hypothetical protein